MKVQMGSVLKFDVNDMGQVESDETKAYFDPKSYCHPKVVLRNHQWQVDFDLDGQQHATLDHRPEFDDSIAFVLVIRHDIPQTLAWCFAEEWSQEEQKAADRQTADEQELAERHERSTRNPRTIEDAVSLSWQIIKDDGRQVILTREFDGKQISKTMYRSRYAAKKSNQLARASA